MVAGRRALPGSIADTRRRRSVVKRFARELSPARCSNVRQGVAARPPVKPGRRDDGAGSWR